VAEDVLSIELAPASGESYLPAAARPGKIDHAHDAVPIPERGHDHGVDHGHVLVHDYDQGNGTGTVFRLTFD
jgi:hypothetical protein